MKVLFVDDEKIIREGMPALINWEQMGCEELRLASSAKQAIDTIKEYPVDLVITDICMRGMTGIEFAKHLKQYKPDIKVIILSAYENFDYAREAIEAGVIKYLLKPIMPEELELAVKEAMKMINNQTTLKNRVKESERMVNIYRPIMARDFWKTLLRQELLVKEEVARRAYLSGIILPDKSICCLSIIKKELSDTNDSMFYFDVKNIVEKLFEENIVDIVELKKGSIVVILNNKLEQIKLIQLEEKIADKLSEYVYVAQGDPVDDIMELPASLKQAQNMIEFYLTLKQDNQIAAQTSGPTEEITRQAVTMIEENFCKETLSVNDIAAKFCVSSSYLSRVFKKQTGKTCIDYITTLRIEKAKKLLSKTNLKHYQIAQEIGYSNVYYFSLQFKKQTGETPGQYRKRMVN